LIKIILLKFFGQENQIQEALQGYHPLAAHWSCFWPSIIEHFNQANCQLIIDDRVSSFNVNILWIIDIPPRKKELTELFNRVHAEFVIYQQIESPLSHPAALNPKNFLWADAVISYDPLFLFDCISYGIKSVLDLRLSFGLQRPLSHKISYQERKTLALVNTNLYYGLLKPRQAAASFFDTLPVINWYQSGYNLRNKDVMNLIFGERYSLRRNFSNYIENIVLSPTNENNFTFDIYGHNWTGEAISWLHKFVKPKSYTSSKGKSSLDKLELLSRYKYTLAIENYEGKRGYISEKIIDPLLAGSVPIYLGDHNVGNYIPQSCFISISSFASKKELFKYLASITESDWMDYQSAIDSFLSSDNARIFDADYTAFKLTNFVMNLTLP